MTRRSVALLGVLGVLLLTAVAPKAATQVAERAAGERHGLRFRGLKPGEFVVHRQRVPVDIVLIGFTSDQVNQADLLGVCLRHALAPMLAQRVRDFVPHHGSQLVVGNLELLDQPRVHRHLAARHAPGFRRA